MARELLKHPWLKRENGGALMQLDRTLLENMKNFHGAYKLRQAVFEYIANYLTSVDETETLRKTFIALDTNHDGLLSIEELENGYASLGLLNDLNLSEIMAACDSDGNGYIDYSEFLTAGLNWKQSLNNTRLQAAFDAFDLDHSGYITVDEIKKMLGGQNEGVGDDIWKQMLEEADENGDGMIDLQEFKNLMTRRSLTGISPKAHAHPLVFP
jgi:calcium-dependent protein kinase